MTNPQLAQAANLYLTAGGLSLIPIIPGTKRPMGRWQQYQRRRPSITELNHWLDQGVTALGMVCGCVSGNVEVIDFDSTPNLSGENAFNEWLESRSVIDIMERHDIPVQRTGSGSGIQIAYRCATVERNQKLAWAKDSTQACGKSVMIETRGELGQALVPPSLHPSGGQYQLLSGRFSQIPIISPNERRTLLDAARSMNEVYEEPKAERKPTQRQQEGDSLIDRYNASRDIYRELERVGYTPSDGGRLSRPGQPESAGVIVHHDRNKCYCYSSNDPLAFDRNGRNQPASPFDVLLVFDCDGDWHKALKKASKSLNLPR